MDLKQLALKLKEPFKPKSEQEDRRLKSYAKLVDELFQELQTPAHKTTTSVIEQCTSISTAEWNNIPHCICEAINIVTNACFYQSEYGTKNHRLMQELVHIITFNTEVLQDRIEQRLQFLHQRDNSIIQQLVQEKDSIIEELTIYADTTAEGAGDKVQKTIMEFLGVSLEEKIEMIEGNIRDSMDSKFEGNNEMMFRQITDKIDQEITKQNSLSGLIGKGQKFENVVAFILDNNKNVDSRFLQSQQALFDLKSRA